MSRLQDFQTVTPSAANDNMLIVQSAGQGLAKINIVGQKIATDTTVSSLATTSKNLAGAINEVNTKVTSTASTNAMSHLGFYLDSNGGLCQVNSI